MALDHEKLKDSYFNSIDQGLLNVKRTSDEAYRNAHKDDDKRFRVKPTQASVIIPYSPNYTMLAGVCNRSAWFSNLSIPDTNPSSVKGERRMDMGKIIEEREHMYAEHAPNMKVISKNMRLKVPLIDDIMISGELDRLSQDPDSRIVVVEIKTFYGYDARKEIMGAKEIAGRPKYQHLLQTFVYLYMLQQSNVDVKYAVIHYIDRTDFEQQVFIVEMVMQDGDAYPVINGRMDRNVRLSSIIARYTQLGLAVKNRQLPPRDCDIIYSDKKILELADQGIISKNKLKKYTSGEAIPGDYQCSYCNHKNLCYGINTTDPKKWHSDSDVMNIINNGGIIPVSVETVPGEDDGWT